MKTKFRLLTISFSLLIVTPLYSAVYEASTLYNSVSRSETVQDLYMKRWETNKEKNFYFDIYGKINWVFDFDVNSYNAGTDKYEATELRLTRTYGSMTLALPITGFRETPDKSDFIIALSTTGFHYGLTRDIDVRRNTGETESVSDYNIPSSLMISMRFQYFTGRILLSMADISSTMNMFRMMTEQWIMLIL